MNFSKVYTVETHKSTEESLRSIAKLYCVIWKEPPWNEDFWTVEGVVSDIQKEMVRPQARMFLAITKEHTILIGFTWGYEVYLTDLREISGTDALDQLFARGRRVFYVDELGVRADARNKGVGKKLSLVLLKWARSAGCTRVVLRTDVEAQAAKAVYAKLGFKETDVRDALHKERTYWIKKMNNHPYKRRNSLRVPSISRTEYPGDWGHVSAGGH